MKKKEFKDIKFLGKERREFASFCVQASSEIKTKTPLERAILFFSYYKQYGYRVIVQRGISQRALRETLRAMRVAPGIIPTVGKREYYDSF